MNQKNSETIIIGIITLIIIMLIYTAIATWIWNSTIVTLFNAPMIKYSEMLSIKILINTFIGIGSRRFD